MERSQKYDWFKGKKDQSNKAKAKDSWKIVWKFTKIFALFSLFFISLWGCGQSFAIKQDSHVGKSLELYGSESEIAPHVTQYKLDTDETASGDQIYSLSTSTNNVWLKTEVDGANAMKQVKAEINSQGVKMSDAYKGVNESFSLLTRALDTTTNKFQTTGNYGSYNGQPILYSGTTPIVFSSAVHDSNEFAKSGLSKLSSGSLINKLDALMTSGDIKLLSTNWTTTTPESVFVKMDKWEKTKTNPNATKPTPTTVKQMANEQFKSELFNAINNVNNSNWMWDALTLQGKYAFAEKTPLVGDDQKDFDLISKAQKSAQEVLGYLGYSFDETKGLSTNMNYMPGSGGQTYRPIVTWGQAWERGFGPFYGLVAYPVGLALNGLISAFPIMAGWESLISMVIIVILLRLLAFLISFKSTMQQTKMQELTLKKATIDAKYVAYKDNKQMQARKQQEISAMYKKENVNPLASISSIFITMPIFLAMWRVISSIPHLKATVWLGMNFSATSWKELFSGHVQYLPLLFIALASSLFSSYYGKMLTKKREKLRGNAHLKTAMKKTDRTQLIVIIISAFISIIFTAGIQIYSIVVSLWTIFQTHLTHYLLIRNSKKRKEQGLAAKAKK